MTAFSTSSRGRKLLVAGIIWVALLGAADATYLTVLKVQDEVQGRADSAVCNAVSETGCTIALESSMSSIGPVPVSLLAVATYLFVIGLGVLAWRAGPGGAPFAVAAIKLIAVGSVVYSIVLAGYSYSQDSWCPFCIGLYAINALMLGCALALEGRLTASLSDVFGRARPVIVAFGVFAVVLSSGYGAFAWSIRHYAGDEVERGYKRADDAIKQGVFPMPIGTSPSRGPADAPITIVKFSDFECPYCRRMWNQIEELVERNPDQVRVVFHHNPLSNVCNPMMGTAFHKSACPAAFAAHCAHVQGKFWEYGDLLFKHQPKFKAAELKGYAEEVGLDVAAFDACLADPATAVAIEKDAMLARAIGAGGTPSSIINGFLFPGALTAVIVESIAEHLEKTGAAKSAKPNEKQERQRAILAAGAKAVAVSPRDLGAGPAPRLQVVTFVDPDHEDSRRQLALLFKLQLVHKELIRVSVRLLGSGKAQKLLACGFETDHGSFVAKMVGQSKGDVDELSDELARQMGDLRPCLDSDGSAAILAEDAAAAKTAGVTEPVTFMNGYQVPPSAGVAELDQLIAASLLAGVK